MRGPFIPIYGCGAIVMLLVGQPLMNRPVLMFFAGLISASTMEYITGETMEAIFKVRYWDYSKAFLNLRGYICLAASLLWGTFTIVLNYLLHRPVARLVLGMNENVLHYLVMILMIYFVADFALSFKTALDLRDLIIAYEKVHADIDRLERRMDVVIAFALDTEREVKERVYDRVDDKIEFMQERLDALENKISLATQRIDTLKDKINDNEKIEDIREQIVEARVANAIIRQQLLENAKKRRSMLGSMIRNNPVMASRKFERVLEEIKERAKK